MIQQIFNVFIDHMYVFGEISIQIFGPFLNWFVFLLLSCKSSLYIPDTSPLSNIRHANIFSQTVGCLFHFIDGVIKVHTFLILSKSNLYIFLMILVFLMLRRP